VVSLIAVSLAAALVSRVFLEMGSSATRSGTRATRTRPHVPEQNPYEWLMMRNLAQARSLGVLTGTCITVFAVMLVASVATSHWQAGFPGAFFIAFAVHLIAKLRFAMETTRQVNADFTQRTLELLLVTTVTEESIIDGHHGALRRVAQRPLALLIGLNLVLQLCVIVLAEPLHMDNEATVIFSSLFIGGILLARADFSTLRWLGLINGLKSPTQVKATLKSYATAMLVPWVGMGLVISVIASLEPKASGLGLIICAWVGACWWYDWFLVRLAHDRLRVGLRRLASESS